MSRTNTVHFEMLGAPLANPAWSWGAVAYDGTVILRVWADHKVGDEFLLVGPSWGKPVGKASRASNGYGERLRHIELIKAGAPCKAISCWGVMKPNGIMNLRNYDSQSLFVIGSIREDADGNVWGKVVSRVPVKFIKTVSIV